MAESLTLETTVVQRETGSAAEIMFVPTDSLRLVGIPSPNAAAKALDLSVGVPIHTSDELQDLLFASLAGRVVPFDPDSFDRWRPQRIGRSGSAEAVFAEQLATSNLVPVSSSPIRGTSLTKLLSHGSAWTLSGADALIHTPLQGLGVLIVAEAGITVAQVIGAGRETAVIWVKWRLRQRLGIPSDWLPPEDRH